MTILFCITKQHPYEAEARKKQNVKNLISFGKKPRIYKEAIDKFPELESLLERMLSVTPIDRPKASDVIKEVVEICLESDLGLANTEN